MPSPSHVAVTFTILISVAVTARAATLDIIPIANAGVMLRCGSSAVLVDAVFREGVKGYETIEASRRSAIEAARPPFDGVVLLLATHPHRDHFDADAVAAHLRANPRAEFWGTPQTAGVVAQQAGERARVLARDASRAFDGGRVTFFAVPHNQPHRTTIENAALLVEFCGQRTFFSGDAELSVADFEAVRRAAPAIDAAILPWWFLTSRGGREIIDTVLKPRHLWAAHGDLDAPDTWIARVKAAYPEARIAFGREP